MALEVTTEDVSALAAELSRCARDLHDVQADVAALGSPDLRAGSASLDQAVDELRRRWSPFLAGLHDQVYRLHASLEVAGGAYELVDRDATALFTGPLAASS